MKYPEHEKLKANQSDSQTCGEFLEHLAHNGIVLARPHYHTEGCGKIPRKFQDENPAECGYCSGELALIREGTQDILASYFGIDLGKLENERRAMLKSLRKTEGRCHG